MKRADLIRHLERYGCEFLREGGNYTVYVNRREKRYLQFLGIGKLTSIFVGGSAKIWEFPSHNKVLYNVALHSGR